MQVKEKTLIENAEMFVRTFFKNHISEIYAYHDIEHTFNVVKAVEELTNDKNLDSEEVELLKLAAFFHDLGYDHGAEGHEIRSADYATQFLLRKNYPPEKINIIRACILATKYPQTPQNFLEKLLCDADLNHLGKDNYWQRCNKVRKELELVRNITMTEEEWIDFELEFMQNHTFHTDVARQLYQKSKQEHIDKLLNEKARLIPQSFSETTPPVKIKKSKKKSKKKKKNKKKQIPENPEFNQMRLGRGVETMYRTTYRTHVNLSSIADNKANIMLSINAIIVSITISTLVPNFSDAPKLIFPTLLLLGVCLASIVFATLSTMPKVTEGIFTREDIQNKKSNLLFFGNFYNMKMEDFHWGMMEMIKDSDFLYSSMTRDLYFLGKVLAKKYNYLRTCYRIFMYGLIAAVLAFAYVFVAG